MLFRSPGLDGGAIAAALGVDASLCVEEEPGEYRIAAAGDAGMIAGLANHLVALGAPLDTITTGRTTLEDVYLQLTEEDA